MRLFGCSLFLVAACGGGGGDVEPTVDASSDPPPDAPPACLTPEGGYGAVTAGMQAAFFDMTEGETTPDFYELDATLDASAAPDVMLIQLYKGFGAFAEGYPTTFPATYSLTGDEAQFALCGACVLVLADTDAQGMAVGNPYLATGGTLTIESITPTLTGTVSGLTLTRVIVDEQDNSTADGSGCSTTLDSMPFSATPMMVPSALTSTP